MARAKCVVAMGVVIAALVVASTARAQAQGTDVVSSEWSDALEVSASFGVAVGQINFAADEAASSEAPEYPTYWTQTYAFGAGYSLGRLDLSLSTAFMHYVLATDQIQLQPFEWRGTYVGARWDQPLVDELVFSPFLEVALPTRPHDRDLTFIVAPKLGMDLHYDVADRARVGLSASFRRNIHAERFYELYEAPRDDFNSVYTVPTSYVPYATPSDVVRPSAARMAPRMIRPAGFASPLQTRDVLSLGAAASVDIIDELSLVVGYSYLRASGYRRDSDDEFTPSESDRDPSAPVATAQTATIDLEYVPVDWVTVGAGTVTHQPLRTPDNQRIRFPFWNTQGAASNFSKLRLYAIFRY